jgi:hypothetical protein
LENILSLAYQTTLQLDLPGPIEDNAPELVREREGTFTDNMKLPIHRWYRYSAGFSAEWVEKTMRRMKLNNSSYILDPFAGSGTVLLCADTLGINSVGFESHPFVSKIATSKLRWNANVDLFCKLSSKILNFAKNNPVESQLKSIPLLSKCYSLENLLKLESLREAFFKYNDNSSEFELLWLAITSILRITSTAGTAQWQYILPNKPKSNVIDAFDAFELKIQQMSEDMLYAQSHFAASNSKLLKHDAREILTFGNYKFDALITSPPYPNNYDYADATRLELLFWGELNGWAGLQNTIRKFLIRSCSQHSAAERLSLDTLLGASEINPIKAELSTVCDELAKIRLTKGGKKTYHTMIAAYYLDIAKTFIALRKIMKKESLMCFVIGDSAPYGVYAPADKWFSTLAISAGFISCEFDKIRDRNTKWKNRKHRVPLQEGRLWIRG